MQKPNEKYSLEEEPKIVHEEKRARIKIYLEIDLIAVILLIAGLITRLYRLEEPRSIVLVT